MKLGLNFKQIVEIETFDGKPVYDFNGRDMTYDELQGLSMPERANIGIEIDEDAGDDPEDYSEIYNGLFLPVKNRVFHEINHNIITTNGLNMVADFLSVAEASSLHPNGMRLGTGTTAAALGDQNVELKLDVSGDYQAFSSGYPIDGGTNVQFRSFWDTGDATHSDITEVVMTTASSSNNAVSRLTFAQIVKGASDTLQITITWTLQNG